MEQEILLTRHDKAGFCWAEITLNRPDKGNALTLPMLECLADIADELRRERDTRAVCCAPADVSSAPVAISRPGEVSRRTTWAGTGSFAGSRYLKKSPPCRNR